MFQEGGQHYIQKRVPDQQKGRNRYLDTKKSNQDANTIQTPAKDRKASVSTSAGSLESVGVDSAVFDIKRDQNGWKMTAEDVKVYSEDILDPVLMKESVPKCLKIALGKDNKNEKKSIKPQEEEKEDTKMVEEKPKKIDMVEGGASKTKKNALKKDSEKKEKKSRNSFEVVHARPRNAKFQILLFSPLGKIPPNLPGKDHPASYDELKTSFEQFVKDCDIKFNQEEQKWIRDLPKLFDELGRMIQILNFPKKSTSLKRKHFCKFLPFTRKLEDGPNIEGRLPEHLSMFLWVIEAVKCAKIKNVPKSPSQASESSKASNVSVILKEEKREQNILKCLLSFGLKYFLQVKNLKKFRSDSFVREILKSEFHSITDLKNTYGGLAKLRSLKDFKLLPEVYLVLYRHVIPPNSNLRYTFYTTKEEVISKITGYCSQSEKDKNSLFESKILESVDLGGSKKKKKDDSNSASKK